MDTTVVPQLGAANSFTAAQSVSTGRGTAALTATHTANSEATYGILDESTSSSNTARGVYGWASVSSGTIYGVYGVTGSPTGYGVYSAGNAGVSGNLKLIGTGNGIIFPYGTSQTTAATGGSGGGGGVSSVAPGDTSITIGGTISVPTVAVSPAGITAAKLAPGSVTNASLAANSVTNFNIADAILLPTKIAEQPQCWHRTPLPPPKP